MNLFTTKSNTNYAIFYYIYDAYSFSVYNMFLQHHLDLNCNISLSTISQEGQWNLGGREPGGTQNPKFSS